MTTKDKLVDQHIREYEARLLHLDEMLAKAEKVTAHLNDEHHLKSEIDNVHQQRSELIEKTTQFQEISVDHWREELIQAAGPMGVLDILAQRVESLVEELES